MPSTASVVPIVPHWLSVVGTMKLCPASTRLANSSSSPVTPATPKPGVTNSSTARKATPERNSTTSSQPAVPPRKRLQKNRPKHRKATSPPSPIPGALISM